MISQGKVSRGVSYSPKVSTTATAAATSMAKNTNITEASSSSKWSRVRNAFLSKDESLTMEESMSMPSSPTQKTSSFFADTADLEQQPKVKVDEKESSGSRSSGDWHNIHGEIQSNYHQLQRQLSQEFQMLVKKLRLMEEIS